MNWHLVGAEQTVNRQKEVVTHEGFLIAVIFLIIGGAAGGFLALGVGAGFGAAGGIIAGSQAGICFAMETAKSDGLLTEEQIDKVIKDTVGTIRNKSSDGSFKEIEWISSEKECADMMQKLEEEIAKPSK